MNFNVINVFDIAAAALGACALSAVLVLSISVRRWRTRCAAVESTLAAIRRELEAMASISLRTGRRVKRMEHGNSGGSGRSESVEICGRPTCLRLGQLCFLELRARENHGGP